MRRWYFWRWWITCDARFTSPSSRSGLAKCSGITTEERELIGPPAVGHGLLSVVLTEGQRLRLEDLTKDPRSVAFPEHHPVMHALLAVPIVSAGAKRIPGSLA